MPRVQSNQRTQDSDVQYIIDQLSESGYSAEWFDVDATSYGSYARRRRMYIVAIKGVSGNAEFSYIRASLEDFICIRCTRGSQCIARGVLCRALALPWVLWFCYCHACCEPSYSRR